MGDDHHGDAQPLIDVLDEPQDVPGGLGVQGGGGLVAQEDPGAGGQGAGDGHPLLLAAGELGGIRAGPAGQIHELQQLPGPADGLPSGRARQLQGEADVVQGRALHEQVEALKDHADGLAGAAQLLLRQAEHVPAVHDHLPGGGPLQEVDAPHQGALSGPAEADDAKNLAGADLDGHVLQGADLVLAAAEALGQVLELDNGFRHRAPSFLAPFCLFC